MKICSVEGCGGKHVARGYCGPHYGRYKKGLDPVGLKRRGSNARTDDERFWPKVDKSEGCWEWTGGKIPSGYGRARVAGQVMAHRAAWVLSGREIPPLTELDHLCHNRSCVNPDHLALATREQNTRNLRGARSDSKVGIRGVQAVGERYRASVRTGGKYYHGGMHDTPEDAGAAAEALRLRLFGPTRKPPFPKQEHITRSREEQ